MSEGNDKNNIDNDEVTNVIDFTVAKLEHMAAGYEETGMYSQADEVYNAIEQYKLGMIAIKWQKGMPYIVLTPDETPKKPGETS